MSEAPLTVPEAEGWTESMIKRNMAQWAGAARAHGPVIWNGVILGRLTPAILAANPHRTQIEFVLGSAVDPTGAVIGLAPFQYEQIPGASPSVGLKSLPRASSLTRIAD